MDSGSIKAAIRMLGPIAWLALAAGLQMLGALLYFKSPADPILVSTYFLIAFSIYLFNRFTDHEDSYNYPDQKMYFQKQTVLKAIPVVLISLSMIVLALTDRLVLWHGILIVGGIVYSASIIPFFRKKSFIFIRLKDILFVKNIIVSILWGVTPFAIAAGQKGAVIQDHGTLLILILAFSLTTLITAIAYDVPDANGDRHAGIKTITTRFGEKITAYFLLSIGLAGGLIVGLAFLLGIASGPSAIFFFVILVWTGLVTLPVFTNKINLAKILIKPLLDSQCVFCGIALIVFSAIV